MELGSFMNESQFSKASKTFAPTNPNTNAKIVTSPTLSCGQILIFLSSGFSKTCFLFSHHFNPENKNPNTRPAGQLPLSEKMNACGSSVTDLFMINSARILYPKTKPSKKFRRRSIKEAGLPTITCTSVGCKRPCLLFLLNSEERITAARINEMATKNPNEFINLRGCHSTLKRSRKA